MAGRISFKAWPAGDSAVGVNDQVTYDRPALGETWHGHVTAASGQTAKVVWHSYTPAGGGPRRPMTHSSRVNARDLKRAGRRVVIRRIRRGGTQTVTRHAVKQEAVMTQTKAGGPPFSAGSYVRWPGGVGRIDMIVHDGTVPGVPGKVTGTPGNPAARVTVWQKGDDGKWAATDQQVGVLLSALGHYPPLAPGRFGGESKDARLVGALAQHEAKVASLGLPAHAMPGARAVLAVYGRGETAWPGEVKTLLSREDWALARVGAFLHMAAGETVPGYTRDLDLLPDGHPARPCSLSSSTGWRRTACHGRRRSVSGGRPPTTRTSTGSAGSCGTGRRSPGSSRRPQSCRS